MICFLLLACGASDPEAPLPHPEPASHGVRDPVNRCQLEKEPAQCLAMARRALEREDGLTGANAAFGLGVACETDDDACALVPRLLELNVEPSRATGILVKPCFERESPLACRALLEVVATRGKSLQPDREATARTIAERASAAPVPPVNTAP